MSQNMFPMPLGNLHGATADVAFRPTEAKSGLAALLSVLAGRKWTLALSILSVTALATVVVYNLRSEYVAEAVIVVGARTPQMIELQPVVTALTINPMLAQAQVETEIQIVRSRGLADRVIARLGLKQDPEFNPTLSEDWIGRVLAWLPDWVRSQLAGLRQAREEDVADSEEDTAVLTQFGRHLGVSPVGRSTTLAITVSSVSPTKAALIANTVADVYLENALAEKTSGTERAAAALTERVRDLRDKLGRSERAVEDYRLRRGLVAGDDKGGTSQQLNDIRSQIALAQAAGATAEARLAQIRGPNASVASSTDVLGSLTIQKLREQEAMLVHDQQGTLTRLGSMHPEAIQKRAAVDAIRQQIRREIDKIAASLQAEAQIQRTREQTLRQDEAAIEQSIGTRRQAEVTLRELLREAEADRNLYELFLRRSQEVTQQLGMQQPDGVIISRATAPSRPAWPPKLLFIGIAAIAAAVTSSFLVVLHNMLRGKFRTAEEVRETLNLPTVGVVPRLSMLQRLRDTPEAQPVNRPGSVYSEAIQLLRLVLRGSADKVILFTSAIRHEGKTAVALSHARMAARAGERVIYIDCDLRRSRIHHVLDKPSLGLASLLSGRCTLEEAVRTEPSTGLAYIAVLHSEHGLPADLLGGQAMRMLVRQVADSYDLVILDTPPVLAATDALLLAPLADTTLLVVNARKTPRRLVRAAVARLAQARVVPGGVILSMAPEHDMQRRGYEYHGAHRAALTSGA
ncbi:GumC family protein [Dankookia sp. P2]|uniref:GumC family protein n=1 Tax=Dankookia sp. P2 TaxID=3423955 RepID=UPI003D66C3DC